MSYGTLKFVYLSVEENNEKRQETVFDYTFELEYI